MIFGYLVKSKNMIFGVIFFFYPGSPKIEDKIREKKVLNVKWHEYIYLLLIPPRDEVHLFI